MTALVREEIELAKVEMTQKLTSIARGAGAAAAGAVFGVFAVVFLLLTIAWGLNSLLDGPLAGLPDHAVMLLICSRPAPSCSPGGCSRPERRRRRWRSTRRRRSGRPSSRSSSERLMPTAVTHARGDSRLDRAEPSRARYSLEKLRVEVVRADRLALAAPAPPEAGHDRRRRGGIRARRRSRRARLVDVRAPAALAPALGPGPSLGSSRRSVTL